MLTRRTFVLAASAAPMLGASPVSRAQAAWVPTKEVEFVIPFGVGGGADLLARVVHKIIVAPWGRETSCLPGRRRPR